MEEMKAMTPGTCNGQKDDAQLRDATDHINDAVHALLMAAMSGSPDTTLTENAVRSMILDDGNTKLPWTATWLAREVAAAALFDNGLQKENSDLKLDMFLISETADGIESVLKLHNIPVCRPWQDIDENICWSTQKRCKWCKRGCQAGRKEA